MRASVLHHARIIVVGLLMAGCNAPDSLPRERVSGTVTLDGKPLVSGKITFMPADPASGGVPAEATIADGAYEVPRDEGPVPGAYRVTISALEPGAAPAKPAPRSRVADATSGTGAPDVAAEAPLRESIPTKYNAQSTLKADVTKGGTNGFDFPMTSK